MTYLADSSGVETSRPREAIELFLPMRVWRIATGTRDVIIGGQRYTAGPAAREEIKIATTEDDADAVIRLPMKHPVPQRWLSMGSPPKTLTANIYRLQLTSGEYRRLWSGYVTSLGSDNDNAIALLRVPSRASALLDRRLPPSTEGRLCNHTLYDRNCRVDRAANTIDATVTSVDGRTIKVNSIAGHVDDWSQGGELLHVPSGQAMTIYTQVGVTITMQAPIPELKLGDAVKVSAGCPHDITSCRVLFDNRVNFGGFPQLNTINPLKPTGFGIWTSE